MTYDSYAPLLYVGILALLAVIFLWVRHVEKGNPRYIWIAGVFLLAAVVVFPYSVIVDGAIKTFYGFPFLVLAIDERGRAFTGVISILALIGNYFLWTGLLRLVLLLIPIKGPKANS